MKIDDILDMALLNEMVEQRYVNIQTGFGLRIYNYSQKAQFDNMWNDVTTTCRGLITDEDGNIVARPFRKFFNYGQMESIPDGPFIVQEKMDGSLGIIYPRPDGTLAVATRGSFQSEQAEWATDWLNSNPACLAEAWKMVRANLTPLVEIIYPTNRIVVDYGNKADLTFLAAIDNETGLDTDGYTVIDPETGMSFDGYWPGEVAPFHNGLDMDAVLSTQRDNAEGFVLRWEDGTRVKVKHDEYIRLHRLLTGVNARTIWELLANGTGIDQLIEVVPDEFYDWVMSTVESLKAEFFRVAAMAAIDFTTVPLEASRREQAEIIKTFKYPSIGFAMLDNKNYDPIIWKIIRPEATLPFKKDES